MRNMRPATPTSTMHDHAMPGPHDRATGHADHDKHAGHDPEMFRRRFWLSLLLTVPIVVTSEMVMDWFGYELDFPGMSADRPGARIGRVLLGRLAVPRRRRRRTEGAPARDDAADLDGDRRRVRRVARVEPRLVRSRVLVGARRAGHDHAARPLAGDEGDRPSPGRARGTGRAAARRRRADRSGRHDRARRARRTRASATSSWCDPAVAYPPTATSSTARPNSTSRWSPASPDRSPKAPGDRVVAGTVSTDSSIRVRVTAVGDETALAGIQRLVAEAQASSSRAQVLADRFAALLVLRRDGCRRRHVPHLGRTRQRRRRRRTHRHRARHRLPPRARTRDPARHQPVDRDLGPERDPGQGPARAGAHAHGRCRAVRQDRHVDTRAPTS